MPRKRRFEKARLDVMDLNMKAHLRCGSYLIPGGSTFIDDAHRREMWLRYRDEIMAQEAPGRRPQALWDYELRWPEGSETEEDAIHRLPGTTDAERAGIEANWLHSLRVALQWFPKAVAVAVAVADARDKAAGFHGVPSWFFDRHAPRIRADLEGDRQAWEARRGKVIQLETGN
jgi:hypothetical protein